jgi:hypothetical protein
MTDASIVTGDGVTGPFAVDVVIERDRVIHQEVRNQSPITLNRLGRLQSSWRRRMKAGHGIRIGL